MSKIKSNGALDKRTIDGRQANGKTKAPKANENAVNKALKNTKKAGKKP